jgi:hypothetical protein
MSGGKRMGNMSCCAGQSCGPQGRGFLTSEEKVERLEEYKEWLESEAKGVSEAIAEIKKKK